MEFFVKKKYERFDWKKKLYSLDRAAAVKWQIDEYHRCVSDKIYWFNQYVWIMDTKAQKIVPFYLWDYQVNYVMELDKLQNIFIGDKSREMGISWTTMGWELHKVQYSKNFSALNISRKESEVQDSGNTFHALHGRIAFMHSMLPGFLKQKVHNPFLVFQVQSMNSIIRGESANQDAGRGTQYTFIFVDESAHIKQFGTMWKSLRNSSDAIVLNSTPPKSDDTVDSKWLEIRDNKETGFKHMAFNWRLRPDRDEEWYNKKTKDMTEEEIAQELEHDINKSISNRSYPEYSEARHLVSHKVYYNKNFRLCIFMDFGLAGETMVFAQVDANERMYVLKYKIYKDMLTNEIYADFLKQLSLLGFTGSISDILFVGDVAGTRRSRATKTSVIDEYNEVSGGKIVIQTQEISNYEKMKCMKTYLKRTYSGAGLLQISNEESCLQLSQCMKYITLNKMRDDHVDNKFTHGVNSLEYGVNFIFPLKKADVVMIDIDGERGEMDDELRKNESSQADIEIRRAGKTSISETIQIHGSRRRSLIWQ